MYVENLYWHKKVNRNKSKDKQQKTKTKGLKGIKSQSYIMCSTGAVNVNGLTQLTQLKKFGKWPAFV